MLPAGGQWSEALLARLREPKQPRQHARCPRAFALCAALPHCLAVKTKTGQWGTLKASRRYEPPPRPRCSGYAFGTAGPPLVRFPLAAPREDWCYRDTGVEQAAAARSTTRAVAHCTMTSCFDRSRCRLDLPHTAFTPMVPSAGAESDGGRGASGSGGGGAGGGTGGGAGGGDGGRGGRLLHITPQTPDSTDMKRLPACLRETFGTLVEPSAARACLVWPTVNLDYLTLAPTPTPSLNPQPQAEPLPRPGQPQLPLRPVRCGHGLQATRTAQLANDGAQSPHIRLHRRATRALRDGRGDHRQELSPCLRVPQRLRRRLPPRPDGHLSGVPVA